MAYPAALAQAASTVTEQTIHQKGIFEMLLDSDPIVKFVLLVLIVFSVVSWAIIIYKYRQVKRAQNDSQDFWTNFVQAKGLQEVSNFKGSREGPLFEIFQTAIETLPRIRGSARSAGLGREIVQRKLAQAREEEIYKLEQYTPFLATTASTAPFIGLFGTVWGILTAFWAIGKAGSSSLATVGPYISEALVATAVGLAAAIPAVIAYNYFVNRIKILIKMMDLFIDDLEIKIEEENAA